MINHSTFTPLNDSDLDSSKAIAVQKYAHFIAQVQALAGQKIYWVSTKTLSINT